MTNVQRGRRRPVRFHGFVVCAAGLVHFADPHIFEPLNTTLGFTQKTRPYVYISGGIETAIGLIMLHARTRTLTAIASAGYTVYLAGRFIRTHRNACR